MLLFPDISSWQAGLELAPFPAVIIKATEDGGTGADRYVNPDYARACADADAHGVLRAAYHYLHADDPASEAAFCLSVVGKGVPVMIDVEHASVTGLDEVIGFATALAFAGGSPRMVYLPAWKWKAIGSPSLGVLTSLGLLLVSSDYENPAYPEAAAGWAPYGGVAPTIYQYTDSAPAGAFLVDMNAYAGTVGQLGALWHRDAPPPPVPVPAAPAWPGRTFAFAPGHPLMQGGDVRMWQTRMRTRGWSLAEDGLYGPASASVCRAFQTDSTEHGWPLAEDGLVGPKTWNAAWQRPVGP